MPRGQLAPADRVFLYIYTNNPVKLQANELCIVATCISCRVWCLSRTRSSSRCPSSPECPPCEAGCRRSGDTRWALHQVMVVTAMHVYVTKLVATNLILLSKWKLSLFCENSPNYNTLVKMRDPDNPLNYFLFNLFLKLYQLIKTKFKICKMIAAIYVKKFLSLF